jgi:hypothetical protein
MTPAFKRWGFPAFAAAIVVIGTSLFCLAPGEAADLGVQVSIARPAPLRALPFPRGERAQSVWASGACWSECGSYTTWNLAACLEHDRQGRCVKRADSSDRSCQRECRTSGGPLLPMDF